MHIKGKSLKTLKKLHLLIGENEKRVKLVCPLVDIHSSRLEEIGFELPISVGDYLIPAALGKITSFNAHGKEVKRDDLPFESFSYMSYRSTQDWHGNRHTSVQTRTGKRRPRESIDAPFQTIEVQSFNGELYICSNEFELTDKMEVLNLHITNMMLELFNGFNVIDIETDNFLGVKIKSLNWELLPRGTYPWQQAKIHIESACQKMEQKNQEVIKHRMQIISQNTPDFIATGRAGFNGYFVYGFESKNIYVMESIYLDNATYIFKDDWKDISKLTKNEIINGGLEHHRVIHDKKWRANIRKIFNS